METTLHAGLRPDGRAEPLHLLLRDLLSIEASLVLFIFSGRFKSLPELQSFPVDATLFFFALTFALIVVRRITGHLKPLPMDAPDLLMLGFCALGIVSVFWSSLEPKNIDKTWRFALVGMTGYFFVSILAQDRERRARMLRLIIGFSGILLLYYSYHRWVVGVDMRELQFTGRIQGNNYIEYATHASYLFFVCLPLAIYGPARLLLPAIAGAVASLFALTLIGARGPLVFSVLSIPVAAVALLLRPNQLGPGTRRLLLFLVVLVGTAWAGYLGLVAVKGFSGATEQLYTLERLSLQLSHESTNSLDVRSDGRELAFRRWLEKPLLGWGMGEFRLQHSSDFPHNLALEILMEMGLAGAVLFFPVLAMAVLACYRVARNRQSDWVDAAIALMFFMEFLSHTTVQGYLAESRIYFAMLALMIGLQRTMPRRIDSERVPSS